MKTARQLAALEPMILTPLRDVRGDDWHAAPKGRWTLAQILQHLAIGVDRVVAQLEERRDRTGMRRRATPKQAIARHLVLGVGRIPRGRKTPEVAHPDDRPDPELAAAEYRMGVERLVALAEGMPAERQTQVFVQHPILGDLNVPEWVRFFYVHNRHHLHQISVRLRWLRARKV